MTRSISFVLREAAMRRLVPKYLGEAVDCAKSYGFAYRLQVGEWFDNLTNQERSAFLYLCSLIAEDEHG